MNPDDSSPYHTGFSKYLPSKKIWIALLVIAIIVALYFVVPRVIAMTRHSAKTVPSVSAQSDIIPVATTGDPITRDTLDDGIPDWEKIAVGLNPSDPQSTTEFKNFSATTDPATLSQLQNSTDTDKVSYTIFNNILNSANQTGSLPDSTVTDETNQELTNYVASITPAQQYDDTSLQTVPDTAANQAAYKKQIDSIESMDLFSKTFQSELSDYLSTGAQGTPVLAIAAQIQTALPQLKALPVPAGIIDYQIQTMNALDGFSKVISAYDPTNTDPLYQFANMTLVQTYQYAIIKNSAAILDYYNDPQGAALDKIIAAAQTAADTQQSSLSTSQ